MPDWKEDDSPVDRLIPEPSYNEFELAAVLARKKRLSRQQKKGCCLTAFFRVLLIPILGKPKSPKCKTETAELPKDDDEQPPPRNLLPQ